MKRETSQRGLFRRAKSRQSCFAKAKSFCEGKAVLSHSRSCAGSTPCPLPPPIPLSHHRHTTLLSLFHYLHFSPCNAGQSLTCERTITAQRCCLRLSRRRRRNNHGHRNGHRASHGAASAPLARLLALHPRCQLMQVGCSPSCLVRCALRGYTNLSEIG